MIIKGKSMGLVSRSIRNPLRKGRQLGSIPDWTETSAKTSLKPLEKFRGFF
jgi:hypothetical protein